MPFAFQGVWGADECFPFGKHERARGRSGPSADSIEGEYTRGAGGRPMKGSTAMWNYDAVDKKEAERMASLYGEDATRTVEHGTEAETGELLVRSCGNELGFAT